MKNEERRVFPIPQRSQIYFIFQQTLFPQKLTKQTIAFDKTIQIHSNYSHSFLKKLVSQVQKCVMFEGYAILKSSDNQSISEIDRTEANSKFCQFDVCQQVISYRLDLIVSQQKNIYQKQIKQFEQSCTRIHHIIVFILEKYRLQSKINFWLTKFRLQLLKMNNDTQQTQIKSPISTNNQQKLSNSPVNQDSGKIQNKIEVKGFESEYRGQKKKN